MICDWRSEGQNDYSDNDISADERSLVDTGNGRGRFSEVNRRRSWGTSSIASEDGESVLWKRVDYQLELLSAMDESDRENASCSPVQPVVKHVDTSLDGEKVGNSNILEKQYNEDDNSEHSSVKLETVQQQRIPPYSNYESNVSENVNLIPVERPNSAAEHARCPPSTASEILAVVGAQRERRKSLTMVGRRASIDVNQLLGLMNETTKAGSPTSDKAYTKDNDNPHSHDKACKSSDSEDEVNRFLMSSGELRSSSLSSRIEGDKCHPSTANEVLEAVGASRERRRSVADTVRASIIAHQLLGLAEGNSTINPKNNNFQNLEEVEKDIDSEDEVNRFLESIESHESLVSNNKGEAREFSNAAPQVAPVVGTQKVRRVSFANAEQGNLVDQLLPLVDRPRECTLEDLMKVNSGDAERPPQPHQENKCVDIDDEEREISLRHVILNSEKKNLDRRIGRKKKAKKVISLSDQIVDSDLSSNQILTSVAAQRERRKNVVNDIRKKKLIRSCMRNSTNEITPYENTVRVLHTKPTETRPNNIEEKGVSFVPPVATASSANDDATKNDIFRHNQNNGECNLVTDDIFLEPNDLEKDKVEPAPFIEGQILTAVSSQREKRRSVISNIRKSSDERSRRRNSLSCPIDVVVNLPSNPSAATPNAAENREDQAIIHYEFEDIHKAGSKYALPFLELEQQSDNHMDAAYQNLVTPTKDTRHMDQRANESVDTISTVPTEKLQQSASPKISSSSHARPGAVTAAQLMMCALASRSDRALRDGISAQKFAFSNFSLLSVPATYLLIMARNEAEILDTGSAYLAPFTVKSASVIDQFPLINQSQKGTLSPEALSTFCVPNGVLVRFIPRCAVSGARRIGWYGENCERYQLHSFTDEKGDLSYGISIITREELSCEKAVATQIIAEFQLRRRKRRAGRTIARWCCEIYNSTHGVYDWGTIARIRATESRNSWQSLGHEGPMVNGRPNIMRNIRKLGSLMSSSFLTDASVHSAPNSVSNNRKNRSQSAKLNSSEGSVTLSRHNSTRSCSSVSEDSSEKLKRNSFSKKNNDATKAAASQAYSFMIAADKLGEMCIIERCYVLVGTKSNDHALLFYALQQLIDIEREDVAIQQLSATNSRSNYSSSQRQGGLRRLSFGINGILNRDPSQRLDVPTLEFSKEHRHTIISYMQKNLMLSPQQASINLTLKKEQELVSDHTRFAFTLPHSACGQTIVKLPLPNVTLEWGLAILLLNIKISALLVVLKLLLLERSVLVIGRNFEEVTIVASTLRDLLEPFHWASAFMPLLPVDMIDFVSAPVPFIAGVVVKDDKNLHDFERDVRVKDALSSGLSIVNLWRKKVRVTSEPEIAELVGNTGGANPKLLCYQQRLEELAVHECSAFRSFRSFFSHGLSFRERLTLHSMRSHIKKELLSLTRISTETPEDWSPYGDHDETGNFFDFSSAKFVEAVMFKMLSQFKFLEIMSQTQLFVGYVESKRHQSLEFARHLRGAEANFIALWVNFRWKRYAERKRRQG